jgi:hypothetical protein
MNPTPTPYLVQGGYATCIFLAALVSGPLWALTGAWIYHCGRQGKSPVPPLPSLRKPTPADDKPAGPKLQRLGI